MRFPLPHWCIWDAQPLVTANGAFYRVACQLAVAYWRSGCVPLPADEITLASLARVPVPRLRDMKEQLTAAFAVILPALDAEHVRCAHHHQQRVRASHHMTAVREARKRRAALSEESAEVTFPLPRLQETPDDMPAAYVCERGGKATASQRRARRHATAKAVPFTD
jgi:uncharacterized protein YdaU (DUF1376 family)